MLLNKPQINVLVDLFERTVAGVATYLQHLQPSARLEEPRFLVFRVTTSFRIAWNPDHSSFNTAVIAFCAADLTIFYFLSAQSIECMRGISGCPKCFLIVTLVIQRDTHCVCERKYSRACGRCPIVVTLFIGFILINHSFVTNLNVPLYPKTAI